jgi:sigma-E factor negative regulatory protein RseA
MNEELDSQLSAMFDDELAPEQCELLARRLSRDEQLKSRWGRYAVIGAAIRSERGVSLNPPLAGRVSAVILAEPALSGSTAVRAARRAAMRWWQPLAGVAVAAGVAAVSILWLRAEAPLSGATLTAQRTSLSAAPAAAAAQGASYVVPRTPAARPVLVPSTTLANYVVAHSMVSSPVARRNLLSAFMTSESNPASEPIAAAEEPHDVQANIP